MAFDRNPHALPYDERHFPFDRRGSVDVWPDGARVAALFYFAAEEWEWDRGEPAGPRGNRREEGPPSLSARTGVKYGFDIGIPRLRTVVESRDVAVTVFTTGNAVVQHPEAIAGLTDAGHEIAAHSYSEGRGATRLDRDELGEDVRATTAIIEEATGTRPVGWLGPGAVGTVDLLEVLAKEDYLYDADLQDDELPYFIDTDAGTLVQATYRMVGNINDYHLPISSTPGRMTPDDVVDYLTATFDVYYETAAETPLVFNYGMHPYVSGRPDGAYALAGLLDHLATFDDVWIPTYRELAEYWVERFGDGYP